MHPEIAGDVQERPHARPITIPTSRPPPTAGRLRPDRPRCEPSHARAQSRRKDRGVGGPDAEGLDAPPARTYPIGIRYALRIPNRSDRGFGETMQHHFVRSVAAVGTTMVV